MAHREVESLYDEVLHDYEAAYHPNPGLKSIIKEAVNSLPPHAQVLDVGCGTGQPATEALTAAGCEVTGIDLSNKMVELCRKRYPGTFIKADMTRYYPEQKFDAIFAVFSLFHVSHRQCYSLLFKFSEWLRQDGLLFIGTIYSDDLVSRGLVPDENGIMDLLDLRFMHRNVPLTTLPFPVWTSYLTAAGFRDIQSQSRDFKPHDPTMPISPHSFITATKGSFHPLMGPYPLPDPIRQPTLTRKSILKSFDEHLVDVEHREVKGILKENTIFLTIGNDQTGKTGVTGQQMFSFDHSTNVALPFPDGHFDAVVVTWGLERVKDINQAMAEILRVMNATAPGAKIIIIQAAPDNDVVKLVNKVCAPLSSSDKTPIHHGAVLNQASEVLKTNGFGDIELRRVYTDSACDFSKEFQSQSNGCAAAEAAAELLSALYYDGDSNLSAMQEAFVPALQTHVKESPYKVGTQSVMIIAKPVNI
ncbi:hypothetical protein FQN57_000141 [Myotisia sp. PD_48]|nr:hypothetical protein FQN57_000141 [Myotisia sp. PD_48]